MEASFSLIHQEKLAKHSSYRLFQPKYVHEVTLLKGTIVEINPDNQQFQMSETNEMSFNRSQRSDASMNAKSNPYTNDNKINKKRLGENGREGE